jgi:hypothetical protein
MTIVVPLADQQKIRSVILNDEGGFIFDRDSSQETDPDGGWTWAGVTRNSWEAYWCETTPFEVMRVFVENNQQTAEDMAIEIYYIDYAKPLQAFYDKYGRVSGYVTYNQYELSCAVNIGTMRAKTILQNVGLSTDELYNKRMFLQAWMLHYITLVQDNAVAWRHYAMSGRPSDKPKTFRAPNLKGWFNRVERYR